MYSEKEMLQVENSRLSAQPETAWYRERLYQEQRNARVMGLAIWLFGVILLLAALFLAFAHNWANFWLFLALALLPLLQGLSLLRASRKPVTPEAIAHLRSEERAQLFHQAQGISLPWQYRHWARLLEVVLGLVFLLQSGQALFYGLNHTFGVTAGIFIWGSFSALLLLGLFLLLDGIYLRPKKARRFIERSSAELAYRLSLGEYLAEKAPTKE